MPGRRVSLPAPGGSNEGDRAKRPAAAKPQGSQRTQLSIAAMFGKPTPANSPAARPAAPPTKKQKKGQRTLSASPATPSPDQVAKRRRTGAGADASQPPPLPEAAPTNRIVDDDSSSDDGHIQRSRGRDSRSGGAAPQGKQGVPGGAPNALQLLMTSRASSRPAAVKASKAPPRGARGAKDKEKDKEKEKEKGKEAAGKKRRQGNPASRRGGAAAAPPCCLDADLSDGTSSDASCGGSSSCSGGAPPPPPPRPEELTLSSGARPVRSGAQVTQSNCSRLFRAKPTQPQSQPQQDAPPEAAPGGGGCAAAATAAAAPSDFEALRSFAALRRALPAPPSPAGLGPLDSPAPSAAQPQHHPVELFAMSSSSLSEAGVCTGAAGAAAALRHIDVPLYPACDGSSSDEASVSSDDSGGFCSGGGGPSTSRRAAWRASVAAIAAASTTEEEAMELLATLPRGGAASSGNGYAATAATAAATSSGTSTAELTGRTPRTPSSLHAPAPTAPTQAMGGTPVPNTPGVEPADAQPPARLDVVQEAVAQLVTSGGFTPVLETLLFDACEAAGSLAQIAPDGVGGARTRRGREVILRVMQRSFAGFSIRRRSAPRAHLPWSAKYAPQGFQDCASPSPVFAVGSSAVAVREHLLAWRSRLCASRGRPDPRHTSALLVASLAAPALASAVAAFAVSRALRSARILQRVGRGGISRMRLLNPPPPRPKKRGRPKRNVPTAEEVADALVQEAVSHAARSYRARRTAKRKRRMGRDDSSSSCDDSSGEMKCSIASCSCSEAACSACSGGEDSEGGGGGGSCAPAKAMRKRQGRRRRSSPASSSGSTEGEEGAEGSSGSGSESSARPPEGALVVCGPKGVGKTSAVYAIAAEAGFHVIEIGASRKRSREALNSEIRDATQSRFVSAASGGTAGGGGGSSSPAPSAGAIHSHTPLRFEEPVPPPPPPPPPPVVKKPVKKGGLSAWVKPKPKPKGKEAKAAAAAAAVVVEDAAAEERVEVEVEEVVVVSPPAQQQQQQGSAAPVVSSASSASASAPKNPDSVADNILVLFEGADVAFPDEVGFLPTVKQLVEEARCPIVITCNRMTPALRELAQLPGCREVLFTLGGSGAAGAQEGMLALSRTPLPPWPGGSGWPGVPAGLPSPLAPQVNLGYALVLQLMLLAEGVYLPPMQLRCVLFSYLNDLRAAVNACQLWLQGTGRDPLETSLAQAQQRDECGSPGPGAASVPAPRYIASCASARCKGRRHDSCAKSGARQSIETSLFQPQGRPHPGITPRPPQAAALEPAPRDLVTACCLGAPPTPCYALADYLEGFATQRGTCWLAGSSAVTNSDDVFGCDLVQNNYLRFINGDERCGGLIDSIVRRRGAGPTYRPRLPRPAFNVVAAAAAAAPTEPPQDDTPHPATVPPPTGTRTPPGPTPATNSFRLGSGAAGDNCGPPGTPAAAATAAVSPPGSTPAGGAAFRQWDGVMSPFGDEPDEDETPMVGSSGHSNFTHAWWEYFQGGGASEARGAPVLPVNDMGCRGLAACARVARTTSMADVWGSRARASESLEILHSADDPQPPFSEGCEPEHGVWWLQRRGLPDPWIRNSLCAMALRSLVSECGEPGGGGCSKPAAAEKMRNYSLRPVAQAYTEMRLQSGVVVAHPLSHASLDSFMRLYRHGLFGNDKGKRDQQSRLHGTSGKVNLHEYVSYTHSMWRLVQATDFSKQKRGSAMSRLRRDLLAGMDEAAWGRIASIPCQVDAHRRWRASGGAGSGRADAQPASPAAPEAPPAPADVEMSGDDGDVPEGGVAEPGGEAEEEEEGVAAGPRVAGGASGEAGGGEDSSSEESVPRKKRRRKRG